MPADRIARHCGPSESRDEPVRRRDERLRPPELRLDSARESGTVAELFKSGVASADVIAKRIYDGGNESLELSIAGTSLGRRRQQHLSVRPRRRSGHH
jgi:hypothetical protein